MRALLAGLVCAIGLTASGVAQAKLDTATQDFFSGNWGPRPNFEDGVGSSYAYWFEFTRDGGVVYFGDGVSDGGWSELLTATRSGENVRMLLRSQDGKIRTARFKMAKPDQLVVIGPRRSRVRLTKVAAYGWSPRALANASIRFFSDFPPQIVQFVDVRPGEPWSRACARRSAAATKLLQVGLVGAKGLSLDDNGANANDAWSVDAVETLSDGVSIKMALTSTASGRQETVHLDRLSGKRMRIREWDRSYFRCVFEQREENGD